MMQRCECGKAIRRKHASKCSACVAREATERLVKARAVVESGTCPDCGQALRRNRSMADWWQCSGFGAEGWRVSGSKPCGFQIFA